MSETETSPQPQIEASKPRGFFARQFDKFFKKEEPERIPSREEEVVKNMMAQHNISEEQADMKMASMLQGDEAERKKMYDRYAPPAPTDFGTGPIQSVDQQAMANMAADRARLDNFRSRNRTVLDPNDPIVSGEAEAKKQAPEPLDLNDLRPGTTPADADSQIPVQSQSEKTDTAFFDMVASAQAAEAKKKADLEAQMKHEELVNMAADAQDKLVEKTNQAAQPEQSSANSEDTTKTAA